MKRFLLVLLGLLISTQVAFGQIEASQAQAEAGTAGWPYVLTPRRGAQAIAALGTVVSLTNLPPWSAGTDYAEDDTVSHNGSSWFAQTNPTTGEEPGVANDWTLIAEKGDTGATGATGAAGADGADGATGATGNPGADGTLWYTVASGTPSDATGVDGDFMFRQSDGAIFRKASGTWGSALFTISDLASLTVATLTATTLNAEALGILDNVNQSHALSIIAGSDLTAARNLTINTGDAARTVTINGDVTLPAGTLATETVVNAKATQCFALTIDDVADSMDYAIGYLPAAATISRMVFVHAGTGLSSPDIDIVIRQGTDRSATGTAVVTAGTTVTSSTTGSVVTSFDDATCPSGSFVWAETSSKSGTTDNFEIFVFFTYD